MNSPSGKEDEIPVRNKQTAFLSDTLRTIKHKRMEIPPRPEIMRRNKHIELQNEIVNHIPGNERSPPDRKIL